MQSFLPKDFIQRMSPSQDGRFLPALSWDYAKVDERTLDDLLRLAVEISKLIKYYNFDNEEEGDWNSFFNDELVVLAEIKYFDHAEFENKFKSNIEKIYRFNRQDKKYQYIANAITNVHQIAQKLDYWFNQLKFVESFTQQPVELRTEMFSMLGGKLSEALWYIQKIEQWLSDKNTGIEVDKYEYSLVWKFEETQIVFNNNMDFIELTEKLEKSFQSFYESIIYLKNKSNVFLEQSLKNDTHYPEIALLIAFLQLYKVPQDSLNQLSKRILDYYYFDALQQKRKNPEQDKVYIKFEINEEILLAQVPNQTRFVAGEYESGENIIYTADNSLAVNAAEINEVRTIYAEYQNYIIRGLPQKIMTSLWSAVIPREELTPQENPQIKKTYAPFGDAVTSQNLREQITKPANLGFAVASPSLFLSEGKREVMVSLTFSHDSFLSLNKWLEDLSLAFGEDEDELFIKSFLEAFLLEITAAESWHKIDKYVVTRDKDASLLKISFDIENIEPAIVGFDNEIHEGNFNTSLPILKAILNNQAYIYPYTLMRDLVIEQVSIYAQVSGVKDLILHGDMGELSPSSPFFPFGSTPHVGSYLIIGKNEIFQKSLDSLKLDIEWFNLPKNRLGMFGHYLAYDAGMNNTSFQVNLSILNRGQWIPDRFEDRQKFYLFRTKDNPKNHTPSSDSMLVDFTTIGELEQPKEIAQKGAKNIFQTRFDNGDENNTEKGKIDISKIKLTSNYSEVNQELLYSNTARRGFIKLELVSPSEGFGHNLFPSVLSEVILENAKTTGIVKAIKSGFQPIAKREMPLQPYTPQISSLSLSYSSTSVISLTDRSAKNDKDNFRGQFFHLHPFGEHLVYPEPSQQFTKFLPNFNAEGSLLLGFTGVNVPQYVSFLIEMADGAGMSSEQEKPQIEWGYLVKDEWKVLAPSKIIRDDTENFIKTGIITLELPQDLEDGNTILNPQLYWLRASTFSNSKAAARMKTISTQVLTATLEYEQGEEAHLEKPLDAFKIDMLEDSIVGIQSISQPMKSFGGVSMEKQQEFYVRISERLKHKQRAITAWDYEHLILEKFPQIYKATCLPNMTSQNLNAPGSVLMIVVPHVNTENVVTLEPQAPGELLYEMKEYLQQYTSPFVRLEVRNPSYEKVKILCDIKLAKGYNYGYYVQQLNEDINRYLSATMLANRKTVELGGTMNSADILSYMRTLPYLEFITRFSMIQVAQDFRGQYILLDTATGITENNEGKNKAILQATKPWSVLIPATEHQITVLEPEFEINEIIPTPAGIGNLEVGGDLVVS